MLSKFKNITFLIILITFIFIIVKYYFSEENIKFTNISRSTYSAMTNDNNDKLPVLKSDTNNIIVYKNDLAPAWFDIMANELSEYFEIDGDGTISTIDKASRSLLFISDLKNSN